MKDKKAKNNGRKIRPPIRSSDVTAFYDLPEDEFERLCCDLHAKQENIVTCKLHGVRGQRDKGVDHLADRESGDGKEVGQSKCYEEFTEKDLKNAVDPFFKHLSFWKVWDVRKYILFVASEIQRTEVHAEKENQRKRFEAEGIVFQLWSGRDIDNNLSPHRDLVEKYFPHSKEIQDKICGSREPTTIMAERYRALELNLEAVSSQRTELADALSQAKHELIEQLRETYRCGQRGEALEGLRKLFFASQDKWSHIDRSTRGHMLRIMAMYTLSVENNLKEAIDLANRAKQEDPDGDDAILQAVIAHEKGGRAGIEEALSLARSSTSEEAFNLRGSLLIELGRHKDALRLFDESSLNQAENVETCRLKALAYLCSGNLLDARVHVELAAARKPDWYSVKFTRSLIDYWTAFSPSALSALNPLIPLPVSFDMIKRDRGSLDSLDRVERCFAELESNQQIPAEDRRRICLWRLASLSVHPYKQNEAKKYCLALLAERPIDSLLLRWALWKNYGIERSTLAESITEELDTDKEPKDLDLVTILNGLLLEKRDYYSAFRLLDKHKNPFTAAGHLDIWLCWRVQTIIASGRRLSDAKKAISDISDSRLRDQLISVVMEVECRQKNDWIPLVLHYESTYRETGNVLDLLEACRLKAYAKDYPYVLSKGEELIGALGTPVAVYLVADSAWRDNKYRACSKLLERCATIFPEGVLPPDLRRLSVLCERELGLLPDALQEAKDLAATSGSTQDIMTLMRVLLDYGDLSGMKEWATKLVSRDDVSPAELLSAANIVQLTDVELARLMFRKALEHDIGADLVGMAIGLGYRLGLESEAHQLRDTMQEMARKGEGAFQALNLRQILELRKSQSERAQSVTTLYNKGQMPVHLVSDEVNVPLSRIYHEIPSENEQGLSPLNQPPVMVRFGNRHIKNVPEMDSASSRLYLDVTAILLSAHLEILVVLEEVFPVLYISSATQPLLIHEIQSLTHNQPNRLAACRKVKELADLRKIRLTAREDHAAIDFQDPFHASMAAKWMRSLLTSVELGGFLVDFLPLRSHDIDAQPVPVPEEYRSLITGIGGIIEGLSRDEVITREENTQFLESLSSIVETEGVSPCPNAGASLYLMGTIAETLAGSDLLSKVCQHYQVFIDEEAMAAIGAEIAQEERNSRLRLWLDRLRDRIRVGLVAGKYKVISGEDIRQKPDEGTDGLKTPSAAVLSDLLSLISEPYDVVWYDDRHLSSYSSNNNGAMIAGITEVLGFLRAKRRINEDFYYQKLLQLRSGSMRYIPLAKEEILYHLTRAEVREGRVVESKELSILRRYWAACLLDSDRLQCRPSRGETKHELGFLVWSMRAIQDALTQCWADENVDDERAQARSDWLFLGLYTGTFGCRHLIHDPDVTSDRPDLIGLDLGGLLTAAIGLSPKRNGDIESPQGRYLRWLKARFVTDQFKVNPGAVVAAASVLKSMLKDSLARREELVENHRRIEHSLIVRFLLGMPTEILRELGKEPGLLDRFGVRYARSVNIKGVTFRDEDYWSAAAKAGGGTPQTLNADTPGVVLQVEWVVDDPACPSVMLRDLSGKFNVTNSDPLLGVLSRDIQVRLDALERSREDLDCDEVLYRRMKEDIASIQEPVDRMKYMVGQRENSYKFFCKSLFQKLIDGSSVSMNDLLPPSLKSILNHSRADIADFIDERGFSITFSRIADRLMAEYDPAEVIDRLSCVPISIPERVFTMLDALSSGDRRSVLTKAWETWFSPVSLLHLLRLSLHYAYDDESLLEVANSAYVKLWREPTGATNATEVFLESLKYFESELSNWQEFRELPVPARLYCLWMHTTCIFDLLKETGADLELVVQHLGSRQSTATHMLFDNDDDYLQDVLNPSHLSVERFRCHAIPKVISGIDNRHVELLPIGADIANAVRGFLEGKEPKALTLLRDNTLQKDGLNSLFGGDRGDVFGIVLDEELSRVFSTVSLRETAGKRIRELKENPYSVRQWMDLVAIVGDSPIYADLVNEFLSLFEMVDLEQFYRSDRTGFSLALPMICAQTVMFGSEDLFERITNGIDRLSVLVEEDSMKERDQNEADGQPKKEDILIFLVNAIYMMSRRRASPQESSRFFSETTERVLRISPDLCQRMYHSLTNFATLLPASQMHGIWKLVLVSRAMSHKGV
jgi:tetratricopeptide (TPR) repeat protein